MLKSSHKRILFLTLVVLGTLWEAPALVAQPLPQIPQQQTLTLTRTTPEKLEQALRQICDHRVVVESPYQYAFTVAQNNVNRQCRIRIEPQSNRVFLTGDQQLGEQVFRLIAAIDQLPQRGFGRTIITYQPYVSPELLAQAFEAHRNPNRHPRADIAVRPLDSGAVRQVEYQFQDGGDLFNSPAVAPATPAGTPPGFQPPGNLPVIGMPDDFMPMFLDKLDAVVIDADGPRLKRFTDMIQQIEEISKLSRPKIEVVYLKHVNNVSLGYLISQKNPGEPSILDVVFQTIPGDIRFFPLTSPNAIMLVGWGEAMETARTLLETLDLPTVTEHSRLHIIKLKHVTATQAQRILTGQSTSAFPDPPRGIPSGLIARIQVTVEARSNSLIIQAAPNDLAEVKRILEQIDVPDASFTLQMRTKRLKNTLAPDMKSTLDAALTGGVSDGLFPAFELLIQGEEGQRLIKSGIMSNVKIDTDVPNNTLIIRAPESCLAFIDELVSLLDVSAPEAEIKVFEIKYGDAQSLIKAIQGLIPSNVEGTPGPRLPGSAGEDALIPIRLFPDIRTNTILAAGSVSDIKTIEALVMALDREDLLSRKDQVYSLKNMKAVPIAVTINKYITDQLTIQQASPGVINSYQQIESAVIVVPDEESNSLIISATPRYFDKIIDLIKELDKSPPQVLIKVLIAEITLSKNKEWAAELGLQDPLMFLRGSGMFFNNTGSDNLPANGHLPGTVGTQMLSNFGAGRDSGGGGLIFSASSDYLNIMLRALHEKRRLEVLSSPQVATMNNQLAIVSVGQTVPRVKGSDMTQYGTRDIIDDTDVKLELRIQPTISPEGTIVMQVELRNEKIGADVLVGSQSQRSTIVDKAELQTMISAANNQTVVLGGVITKDENKVVRKVPLLGDIPYLGKLWRHETSKTERKELLVILTPRIVQSSDENDMNDIKQMELARMSWCLSNVVETYGDIGAYSVVSERPYTGNAPVSTPGPVKVETLQPLESNFLLPTLPKRD